MSQLAFVACICSGNGDVLPQQQQQQQQYGSNIAAATTMPIKEQKGENKSRTLVSTCVSIAPFTQKKNVLLKVILNVASNLDYSNFISNFNLKVFSQFILLQVL